MTVPAARNPQLEAFERLDGAYEARVLEPSPGVTDPVARGDAAPGRQVVSPVSTGDQRWEDLAAGDAELASWCGERWLAGYPRLGPPPPGFASTRAALHLLAEHVMSPTRRRDRGETTLRWVRGGFGTPFFGADAQLRVDGDVFIVQSRERVQAGRLTTLQDAAEFVGFDLTRTDVAGTDAALEVDAEASRYLGEVFGFATSVLEEVRAQADPSADSSAVALWPGHFDVALELGRDDLRRRATYGISPGDAHHAEPYVYVAPWSQPPSGDPWNATDFTGAELSWSAVVEAADQRATVLAWLGACRDALHAK